MREMRRTGDSTQAERVSRDDVSEADIDRGI